MDSLQKDYKKHMLMAAHALAVDAKNLLDVIDQSRLKTIRIWATANPVWMDKESVFNFLGK